MANLTDVAARIWPLLTVKVRKSLLENPLDLPLCDIILNKTD